MMKRVPGSLVRLGAVLCAAALSSACGGGGTFDETGLQDLIKRLEAKKVEKALLAERRSGMDAAARKTFDDAFVVKVAKDFHNPSQIVTRVLEVSDEKLIVEARETVEIQALGGIEGICASLRDDMTKVALAQEAHFIEHGVYASSLEAIRFTPSKWNSVTIAPYTAGGYAAHRASVSNPKCMGLDDKPKTVTWDSGKGGFTS